MEWSQDVRESRFGFLPGSGMESRRFTQANWHMDPVRPRMWDLLSEEELTMCVRVSVCGHWARSVFKSTACWEAAFQLYVCLLRALSLTYTHARAFENPQVLPSPHPRPTGRLRGRRQASHGALHAPVRLHGIVHMRRQGPLLLLMLILPDARFDM